MTDAVDCAVLDSLINLGGSASLSKIVAYINSMGIMLSSATIEKSLENMKMIGVVDGDYRLYSTLMSHSQRYVCLRKVLARAMSKPKHVDRELFAKRMLNRMRLRANMLLDGGVCIVDVETTGVNNKRRDYAVSLGALVVNVSGGVARVVDSMYTLIRIPEPSMVEDTAMIHGITPDMLANAPSPLDVCSKFVFMLRDWGVDTIAAWNARFDQAFVIDLFRRAGIDPPRLRWIELQPERYSRLDEHIRRLGGVRFLSDGGVHNALIDCLKALYVAAEHSSLVVNVDRKLIYLVNNTK